MQAQAEALFAAVDDGGDLPTIEQLLQSAPPEVINWRHENSKSRTALHVAAARGRADVAHALIAAGATVSYTHNESEDAARPAAAAAANGEAPGGSNVHTRSNMHVRIIMGTMTIGPAVGDAHSDGTHTAMQSWCQTPPDAAAQQLRALASTDRNRGR
jgi:ankyrin repeat protein